MANQASWLPELDKDIDETLGLSDSHAAQSPSEELCLFPAWARTIGILQSFSYSSQYEFDSDGLKMRVKVILIKSTAN